MVVDNVIKQRLAHVLVKLRVVEIRPWAEQFNHGFYDMWEMMASVHGVYKKRDWND